LRKMLAELIQEQEVLNKLGEKIEVSFEQFFSRLQTLVEGSNFKRVPRIKNFVLVCGAELAPNRLFEEIYVAGVAEGEFPRRAFSQGFTSKEQVLTWLKSGIDIQDPRLDPSFETALFSSLIDRARKRAVVSCPLTEMSGQELTPSSLLYEVNAGKQVEKPFVQPMKLLQFEPTSPRAAVAGWLWEKSVEQLPPSLCQNIRVNELLSELEEPVMVARQRTTKIGDSPLSGGLTDYVATGIVTIPLPHYWSASSLSDYGKCPFRFWVSHILKTQPHIEPEQGLPRRLLGETYHKAMELFYRDVIDLRLSLKDSPEEMLLEVIDRASANAIKWLEALPDFRKDEFWNYRTQEIKFRLGRFILEERSRAQKGSEHFVPFMVESNFGSDQSDSAPPLKIGTKGSEIMIRGRVDRIDVASDTANSIDPRLRVIDYKTSSSPISEGDARTGRNLQLPLYALAVQEAIVPNGKVVTAEYLSISAAKPVGKLEFEKGKSRQQVHSVDLLEETTTNVSNFVSRIKRGDFGVRPSGSKVCATCDHKMICRIAEMPRLSRNGEEGTHEAD